MKSKAVIRDEQFRVYRFDNGLREACKQARAQAGQTVKEFVRAAIHDQLGPLVECLRVCGIQPQSGKLRPARLPLTDGLVGQLQSASEASGIPQSWLLLAVLHRQSHGATAAKPSLHRKARKTAPKQSGKARGGRKAAKAAPIARNNSDRPYPTAAAAKAAAKKGGVA